MLSNQKKKEKINGGLEHVQHCTSELFILFIEKSEPVTTDSGRIGWSSSTILNATLEIWKREELYEEVLSSKICDFMVFL